MRVQLIIAMLVLSAPMFVMGHGYLSFPKSRNYIANSDYCPHCLNAGGVHVVRDGDKKWPAGHHGICGDKYSDAQPQPHEAGGKHYSGEIGGAFVEGQVVNIEITMSTFHMGDFKFRICHIQGGSASDEHEQLTESCLDEHVLEQANVQGAQSAGAVWYHTPAGYSSPPTFTIPVQLPQGLTCDGKSTKCVLQWYWITANSCIPPSSSTKYVVEPLLGTCGVVDTYPEEFWNCADITISSAGSLAIASTNSTSNQG